MDARREIVRRFTQTGHVDAGCAAHVPAMHLVPAFARGLDQVAPAIARTGNEATGKELRAAAAATLGAADALARSYEFGLVSGAGLRGGSYTATPKNGSSQVTLTGVRWTNDLAVSGEGTFNAREARAHAHLTLRDAVSGSFDASWPTAGSGAVAQLDGTIDGHALHASMPAP